MAKQEWTLTTGKSGKKYIRKHGVGIIMLMYNTNVPDVTEIEDDLSARVVAALNYFEGVATEDIKPLDAFDIWHPDLEFSGRAYDYNRHGIAGFMVDRRDTDSTEVVKHTMQVLADGRRYLRIKVWIDEE